MARILICGDCGKEANHQAHGLCKPCYMRRYRPPFIECKECGQRVRHHAKGLCNACYRKLQYREGLSRLIRCQGCGETRRHHAQKLCNSCYVRARYRLGYRSPTVICKRCGQPKPHKGNGLCSACYHQDRRDNQPALIQSIEQRSHQKNKVRDNAYQQEWAWKNRKKVLAIAARYRARKCNLADTLTEEQIKQLVAIGMAMYPGEKLHLDHIVPISKGGGTTRANIHAIPARLNMFKSNRLPQEIYKQVQLFEGENG